MYTVPGCTICSRETMYGGISSHLQVCCGLVSCLQVVSNIPQMVSRCDSLDDHTNQLCPSWMITILGPMVWYKHHHNNLIELHRVLRGSLFNKRDESDSDVQITVPVVKLSLLNEYNVIGR